MVEQPFCARERSSKFVAHGLTMRCTAILVGSSMLLSGFCRTVAAMRRTTLRHSKGRMAGAFDFYIGGNINIEMKAWKHGRGPSIERYDMSGPECRGGGEDVTTYDNTMVTAAEGVQLHSDHHLDADSGEYHTWRAWRSRIRKKQVDYVMGPRDLRSATWYLNKVSLRTQDHFPVGRMDPKVRK